MAVRGLISDGPRITFHFKSGVHVNLQLKTLIYGSQIGKLIISTYNFHEVHVDYFFFLLRVSMSFFPKNIVFF